MSREAYRLRTVAPARGSQELTSRWTARLRAQQSAAAAAEQVKTAKAAQDAAAAGLAEVKEKAVADKAVQYDKWVDYDDHRNTSLTYNKTLRL